MQTVTTIGLDIAKSVFQVHGVDAAGQVVVRRQLKRRYVLTFFQKLPSCLVGIEACASSHYWSRELQALGHTVRLMPPAYVKPYIKRQKNDAADAEAICEAVTRANMRFVETKTPEQQSCLMLHRTRHLFIRQQTAVINAIRAHLAEFGIVAPVGRNGVEELLGVVADPSDKRVPEIARTCLAALGAQLRMLKAQILEFDRMINATDPTRRASGWMRFLVSVRRWPPLWSPASLIRRLSDQDETSRPGSGLCRSSTRAGAGKSSAVSANKATAICAACSPPARWP
jgi:transposase